MTTKIAFISFGLWLASVGAFAAPATPVPRELDINCYFIVSATPKPIRLGATCSVRNRSTKTVDKIRPTGAWIKNSASPYEIFDLKDTVNGHKSKLAAGETFKTTYLGAVGKGGSTKLSREPKCGSQVKVEIKFESSVPPVRVIGSANVRCDKAATR